MSYSRRSRYSRSSSPHKRYGRSVSRSMSVSMSRSRSRSHDSGDVENPGNNLYVTGLSTRITKRDLEKHFSAEGTVDDVHLVVDPWTRESRGFGFVTMSTVEEANRCIKYLNHSVLEGRVITVEKARRRKGRTPTPGRYLGLRTIRVRRRSPSYSTHSRSHSPRYSYDRDGSRTPRLSSPYYSRRRHRSPSPYYGHRRSYSPYYSRGRSPSPYYGHRKSYSPYYSRGRSYSRSRSPYSRSPVSKRNHSYSPYYERYYSPDDHYHRSRNRSISPSLSPRVQRHSRRSYSRSVSPRHSRRRYSCSLSPRRSKRYSRSMSPQGRWSSRRSYSKSISLRPKRSLKRGSSRASHYSCSSRSYSISPSVSASSRSISRSASPSS